MISAALNIGASALRTQQKAIDVVSHNLANVNTPGYSRQVADLGTLSPEKIGNLSLGRGVDLTSVRRLVDPMIAQAQTNNLSQKNYWQTINNGLTTVENVFGSLQSTGLSDALDQFFLSWQQLGNNPQDSALKFNVRSKSDAIITNLANMSQQITAAQASADTSIDQAITSANTLLSNIASLTGQIQRAETGSTGTVGMANDLRDKRDQALRDLSNLIPIQQVQTGDGSFLVQSPSGDLLVQDSVARSLGRGTAPVGGFAPIVIAGTTQPVAGINGGGQIGGLVELRDNKLGNYISQLDSISANLIFSVNQLHASGHNGAGLTTTASQLTGNAAIPLNDPTQTAPFAAQIQTGSFVIHTYDAAGVATPAGGTAINVTAGVTTMNDIVTSLNGVAGISAAVDANGRLTINATTGSFALANDTSNVLAAYEINSFFHGSNTATMSLSDNILASAGAINAGQVDPVTSALHTGDNQAALALFGLQNTAISVDGTPALSLHNRTADLSTTFGTDISVSKQQLQYRTVESDSLTSQQAAISGVNTDEELIQMMQFQRAYEAAAKVVSTTNQMLDSLLGLIR